MVIVTLQGKDFFGLTIGNMPKHYLEQAILLASQIADIYWPSVVVVGTTLLMMLLWPRLKTPVPAHLPAIMVGSVVTLLLGYRCTTLIDQYMQFQPLKTLAKAMVQPIDGVFRLYPRLSDAIQTNQ